MVYTNHQWIRVNGTKWIVGRSIVSVILVVRLTIKSIELEYRIGELRMRI